MAFPIGTNLRLVVDYGGCSVGDEFVSVGDAGPRITVARRVGDNRQISAYDDRFEVFEPVADKYVVIVKQPDGVIRTLANRTHVSNDLASAEAMARRESALGNNEYYVVPVRAVAKFVGGVKVEDF
jgi:hypothetical protein